jgi:lipid-binding SYLF domain-containing protein
MGESAMATLLATDPQAQDVIDESVGYAVLNMTATKIPVVGTGVGYGVVIDKLSDARSYIRVSQFEVGSGMGAIRYKVIIVFSDPSLVQKIAKTAWHYDAGAQATAGDKHTEAHTDISAKGYQAFWLTDSGALASVTVRVAKATPYL